MKEGWGIAHDYNKDLEDIKLAEEQVSEGKSVSPVSASIQIINSQILSH